MDVRYVIDHLDQIRIQTVRHVMINTHFFVLLNIEAWYSETISQPVDLIGIV